MRWLQDITLLRNSSSDKLGLTLCYENHGCSDDDDEPLTDVYVSEVSTLQLRHVCEATALTTSQVY